MEKHKIPETMLQAVRQFADPQVAHEFFAQIRWPNGVGCPRSGCGSDLVSYMPKYRRWYCAECKKQFSAKVGTIFEDSPIGLDKWLPAIWLLASNRNGISSHELGRALKVTQKTAWFMLQRIREAMRQTGHAPMTGHVEADEAYIGGQNRFSKRLRKLEKQGHIVHPFTSKTGVFGLVQRGGEARSWVQHGNVRARMIQSIHPDAHVHTDAAWTDLSEHFLHHDMVNHAALEYARGEAHTNTIEGFWSVLKRTLKGTYIHIAPEHVGRYLNEHVFRFNERENMDGPRFAKATKAVDGKRLTYKKLVAKG
ncbi:MAG TPA: IS1595 family transposase [Candidatus Acidoferrales bacterium]|nr:IS1595 family transposase [Candidatus Acidoferrales bacterium]